MASGYLLFVGSTFSPFQIVLLGGGVLKATCWQFSFIDSNLAHRKLHPCPTSPWKCWPTLTLCPTSRQTAPASSALQTFFFRCKSFTKSCDRPIPKLQRIFIIQSEDPLETPPQGMSGVSPSHVLHWEWGGKHNIAHSPKATPAQPAPTH